MFAAPWLKTVCMGSGNSFRKAEVISFIRETDIAGKNGQALLTAALLLYHDSFINKYILTIGKGSVQGPLEIDLNCAIACDGGCCLVNILSDDISLAL